MGEGYFLDDRNQKYQLLSTRGETPAASPGGRPAPYAPRSSEAASRARRDQRSETSCRRDQPLTGAASSIQPKTGIEAPTPLTGRDRGYSARQGFEGSLTSGPSFVGLTAAARKRDPGNPG